MSCNIPMNTTSDGVYYALKSVIYKSMSLYNMTHGGGQFPHPGVMVIYEL